MVPDWTQVVDNFTLGVTETPKIESGREGQNAEI